MTGLSETTTRLGALKHLGDVFRSVGIETAQRDARLLLLDAARIAHMDLIRAPREPLGPEAAETLARHVEKRVDRVPVARNIPRAVDEMNASGLAGIGIPGRRSAT